MEFGASIFFTDYSITPAELAVAMEAMAPLSPYDLRTAAGRGPERFPAGHRWDSSPKIRFAQDSPPEEAVSSELVSGRPNFPVSRENTGNFIDFGLGRPN